MRSFLQRQSGVIESYGSDDVTSANTHTANELLETAQKIQPREPEIYFARIRTLLRIKEKNHNQAIINAQDQALKTAHRYITRIKTHPRREKYLALYYFTTGLIAISRGDSYVVATQLEELTSLIEQTRHPKYLGKDRTEYQVLQHQKVNQMIQRLKKKLSALH